MKPPYVYILIPVFILSLFGATLMTGCTTAQLAETGNIVSDTLTDAQLGLTAYADLQTALSAAQQVMGGHGVSLNNVVTYAQAEASSANTSGLTQAAQSLAVDIASQIAQGTSPAAVTTQLTQAQTALATQATPTSTPTTNAIYGPTCPFSVATTGN